MSDIRYNWTKEQIAEIYNTPLLELVYKAATIHRKYHNPNEVQISSRSESTKTDERGGS